MGDNRISTTFAREHLRSFIDRIELLESEKKDLSLDISEVYKEARGSGFDPKIMRQVIKLRKMDKAQRDEAEALLDLYMDAVESQPDMFDRETGEIVEQAAQI